VKRRYALALLALAGCAAPPRPQVAPPPALPSAAPAPAQAPAPPPAAAPAPAAPAGLLPQVAEPALLISLATDRASFTMPAGDWLLQAGGRTERVCGAIVVRAPAGAASEPLFAVQAGSFGEREAADRQASALGAVLQLDAAVVEAGGRFTVRVGAAAPRKTAEVLLTRVRADAAVDAFLVGASPVPASATLTVEVAGAASERPSPLAIAPVDGAPVPYGSSTYRGHLLLRATGRGTLHVLNRVNLEDYLLGVVPSELGPKVYDEEEAQKAQTIAARTYALKHRGDFSAEGYDLCSTPRCQAYGGVSIEQALSTDAVEKTAGEVLTYRGTLADTLFTSTCGGRTEKAADVFPGYALLDVPYLASVVCGGEAEVPLDATAVPRKGKGPDTFLGVRGRALLASLGHTASGWAEVNAARQLLRRRLGLPASRGLASLAPAAVYQDLAEAAAFGDLDLLAEPVEQSRAPAGWPAKARAAYAVAVRFQLGNGADLPVERAFRNEEAAGLWASVLTRLGGFEEVEGRFLGLDGNGSLVVRSSKGKQAFPRAEVFLLFRGGLDSFEPIPHLSLHVSERVRVFARDGKAAALVALPSPAAGTYDRDSAWVHWTRRFTGKELAQQLASRGEGRSMTLVKSVDVVERGSSGRAKKVRVGTDRGNVVLTGLEIRFALNLPELLFTVVEGNAEAEPVFTFYGRAWGHGVGLCQNGAFGMALAGHGYREILSHYYPGTEVGPLSR